MNRTTRTAAPTILARRAPSADAVRIDEACCRFEAAWREGIAPRIEPFLEEVRGQGHSILLFELLALELELRGQAGDEPLADEYRERFPDCLDIVEAAFDQFFRTGKPARSAAIDPNPIRQVGDYELVAELARGGMGVVYKARQLGLNRMVALKMILAGPFASEAEIRRFRIEAEAAGRLDHPHIVPILEVGRHQGHAYYTMKLIEGEDLGRHLGRFIGHPRRSATLMVSIAQAVHHAHRRGLIHRDLKPSNILIDPAGHPHITDFGLVKRADEGASNLTASGAVLGTPSYMAPEQAVGGRIGPAADVYSLGAILYQLLTGRPPFRAATVAETLAQLIEQEPTPPRQLRRSIPADLERICLKGRRGRKLRGRRRRSIPADLERICLKCLEKRPNHRYTSAAALAGDLERFLRGDEVHVGRSGPLRRLWRWARREPEYASRLVGQSLILALTQLNFLLHHAPNARIHWGVSIVEGLWLASALVLRRFARSEHASDGVRMVWMTVDVALLTAILGLLGAVNSSLVLGYALVIAASGLWNRIRVVWFTTAISMLGYGALAFETWQRGGLTDSNHYPNVILPVLVVLGFLNGQQIRRIRALSPVDRDTV